MQALLKAAIPVDAPWTVVPIYKVIASMPADKPWIESVVFCKYFFPVFADWFCSDPPGNLQMKITKL
jgi:hypothetical protein